MLERAHKQSAFMLIIQHLNSLRLQQLTLVYKTLMSIAREYQQRKNFAENAIFAEVTIIRKVEVNARRKIKLVIIVVK